MFKLSELKRAVQKLGEVEKPRAERHDASRLGALYGTELPTWPAGVKNISASGIYLATEKRLRTGEVINLVLMEEDELRLEKVEAKRITECRISVHAQVARQGEDGLGLSFVLPPGMDASLWGVLVRNIVLLNESRQIENMFKVLRTILFTCHLCGPEAEESIFLLGGQLNSERVDSLVKIAIAAEDRLTLEVNYEAKRANPKLMTYILREGSWSLDDRVLRLWSGLLISSCSAEPDDANQVCANLLGHMGPEQARIFNEACERAMNSLTVAVHSEIPPVTLSTEEMKQVTDRPDLTRASYDMAYLYHLGLLENLFHFTSYLPIEFFDITPSRLGIEVYKRCQGYRGKLDPDLVEKANVGLAQVFVETPPQTFGQGHAH
jgi:hypothetical protein